MYSAVWKWIFKIVSIHSFVYIPKLIKLPTNWTFVIFFLSYDHPALKVNVIITAWGSVKILIFCWAYDFRTCEWLSTFYTPSPMHHIRPMLEGALTGSCCLTKVKGSRLSALTL